MFNFCFERGWVGTSAPSGDQSLSPSWLHARHSYNSRCVSPEELYLFHFIIAPMAAGRSLILLLLEGCIIPGFSTCVPQLQGALLARQTLGQTDSLVRSVWIFLCPYVWPDCIFFQAAWSVCSQSRPSTLLPACLPVWQLITTVQ